MDCTTRCSVEELSRLISVARLLRPLVGRQGSPRSCIACPRVWPGKQQQRRVHTSRSVTISLHPVILSSTLKIQSADTSDLVIIVRNFSLWICLQHGLSMEIELVKEAVGSRSIPNGTNFLSGDSDHCVSGASGFFILHQEARENRPQCPIQVPSMLNCGLHTVSRTIVLNRIAIARALADKPLQ